MKLIPLPVLARLEANKGWHPSRRIPGTHFTYGEVVESSGASRLPLKPFRLQNGDIVTPWRNAIKHARNLEKLRAQINAARRAHGLKPTGITILSWWRTWAHNEQVGGARKSQHMYLLATDISREEVRRLTPWDNGTSFDRIANEVFKNGGFGQYPGGNRHVDSRGFRARWTSFTR